MARYPSEQRGGGLPVRVGGARHYRTGRVPTVPQLHTAHRGPGAAPLPPERQGPQPGQ